MTLPVGQKNSLCELGKKNASYWVLLGIISNPHKNCRKSKLGLILIWFVGINIVAVNVLGLYDQGKLKSMFGYENGAFSGTNAWVS